jgi:Protein of unknown function (DUF732)
MKGLLATLAALSAITAVTVLGIIVAAPARSTPYCPRGSELWGNPDCLFLFLVNKNAFPVQGVEDATIAKGKEVCNEMSADPGPRPIVDWAVRFTAQHSELYPPNQRVDGRAVSFAQAAAAGYCPWIQH